MQGRYGYYYFSYSQPAKVNEAMSILWNYEQTHIHKES